MPWRLLGVVVFLGLPLGASAVMRTPPDAEGCKDPAGIKRVKGCSIDSCHRSEFDAVDMVVKSTPRGDEHKRLEGQKDVVSYVCPAHRSPQKTVRSVEAVLRRAGFTVVHREEDDDGLPRLTAHKRSTWLSVSAAEQDDEQSRYAITALAVRQLTQAMEKSVDGLAQELLHNGHVTIYGVQFEGDADTLGGDSEKVLRNIAEVLKAYPTWRMRVEVHTDNVGPRVANRRRSEMRGNTVVHWLVQEGGVDKTRLFSMGLGDAQPVSDNRSVEGRARNRRIELVRM